MNNPNTNANPDPITTYPEALAWIYSFSDTERTGAFVRDREDNLRRERELLARLGNPHLAYGVTHIAGTKGKGSTSALLAAILRAAGVRAGLYTQPDLHTFRERMRVDGELIAPAEVVRLVSELRAALDALGNTLGPYITYEVATALAFLYFRAAKAAHAVIEVGLGGRLDATNVVQPMVTVITSISYDHMAVLGDTLAAIAGEKAGIVKPGVPLVTSAQSPEALATITRIANERAAPLTRVAPAGAPEAPSAAYTYRPGRATGAQQTFHLDTPTRPLPDLELGLLGVHQIENAAAAVAAADLLRARGLPIDDAAIRAGLRAARWPARLQVVARAPWAIVDGAHNADSFARMFAALRRHFPFNRLILVLGLMADKDLPGIAAAIARAGVDAVVATAAAYPRAASPAAVAAVVRAHLPAADIHAAGDVSAALAAAYDRAGPRDLICVAGSLYLAAEALRWFATRPDVPAGAIEIAGVDH
jgi:dihydrofolate synthase / folylpolyglutamate synthase